MGHSGNVSSVGLQSPPIVVGQLSYEVPGEPTFPADPTTTTRLALLHSTKLYPHSLLHVIYTPLPQE